MPSAFQRGAFQSGAFQMGEPEGGRASSVNQKRIPRWLLKFERTGKTTFLSDVGGPVLGDFYVPAVVDVSISAFLVDLVRFTAPTPAATVHISPSALREFFLDLDDLGQALVTLSSWDGHTARAILKAKLDQPEWGYDGEVTSFRLSEGFDHNPSWPREDEGDDDGNVVWADKEIANAEQLLNYLIGASGYPADSLTDGQDLGSLARIKKQLRQFAVAGLANSPTPVMGFIASRLQREFMFALWQQVGLLTGAAIDPTAAPARVLVYGPHLLQLQRPVKEEAKYTAFRSRYDFDTEGDSGWQGSEILDKTNNPYLKAFAKRWGDLQFGDPVDKPRDSNASDLADVDAQGTAQSILQRLALMFHRGQQAAYLQLAKFSEIAIGTPVALIDPKRSYDEKPALLIGREWLTPELTVHTFRTIEPLEIIPRRTVAAAPNDAPATSSPCWVQTGGAGGVTIGANLFDMDTTDNVARVMDFSACPVEAGTDVTIDIGGRVLVIGSGNFQVFHIELWDDVQGFRTDLCAYLKDSTDHSPGGCHGVFATLNGDFPVPAGRHYWLKVYPRTGHRVAFSDIYMNIRPTSEAPRYPGSGGCQFPTLVDDLCFDCVN